MASSERSNGGNVRVDEMSNYLDKTAVVFAILFGSYSRCEANVTSDVDVALRFPNWMDAHERFRQRNRIDADLQAYADSLVDVSDIETLPVPIAYAALRDGIALTGDEQIIESYREQIENEYKDAAAKRERERREFIDRLAKGDS